MPRIYAVEAAGRIGLDRGCALCRCRGDDRGLLVCFAGVVREAIAPDIFTIDSQMIIDIFGLTCTIFIIVFLFGALVLCLYFLFHFFSLYFEFSEGGSNYLRK